MFYRGFFIEKDYFMSVNINKKHVFVLTVSAVIAVILCVLRTHLLLNFVEPETGFYFPGTKYGSYFGAAVVIALAACVAGCIFSNVRVHKALTSESTLVVFSSSLCAFLFATVLFYGAYEFFKAPVKNAFFAIELLLCIPCIIFFFSMCAKETREKSSAGVLLSLSPAVYYAIRTIHVFTDTKTQINTSQRELTLVMLCCMMLMFVYEAYFLVADKTDADAEKTGKTAGIRYMSFTLMSMTLSLVSALPYIAVSAFWVFDANFLAMDVLDLCIGVYAFTRAVTLCRQ